MLRKTCVALGAFILLAGLWLSVKPVFYRYSNKLEIYLESSSSSAQITRIDLYDYPFVVGVKGESFKTDKEEFDLNAFLCDFHAVQVFAETTDEGTSVYAYSPYIRYSAIVKGQTVNLHVFTGKTQITVGTPLIFGGY